MKAKQFNYVLIGLLSLAVVGGGAGYYYASQQLTGRIQQLQEQLADVQVVDNQISDLAALQRQYQKVQPLLSKLDGALPRTKDESRLVAQVNNLANANGLSLPGFNFSASSGLPSATTQTAKVGSGTAVPATIQMTGSYGQMLGFLQGLEHMDRLVSVTNLAIAKTDKPNQLAFTMTINAYLAP